MRKRPTLLARAAAVLTTIGVAVAGAVVLTAAPAQAALSETSYGFQATAYGTRVFAGNVQLRSGRTAFSYISCTRLAGIRKELTLDDLANVNVNDLIKVGAVTSNTYTYRKRAQGIVGSRGVNTIASVTLGASGGPQLSLRGLRTTADAWSQRGRLHARTALHTTNIKVVPPAGAPVPGPLQDLIDGATQGIQGVYDALRQNGGSVEVPGLGVVRLGHERTVVRPNAAQASAFMLKVELYGADMKPRTADDSLVAIGRAWARITRNVPAGILHGVGYGAQVDVLDGMVKVGRLASQPLPCEGTHGRVRGNDLAALDLGNAGVIDLGTATGRAYGVQNKDGSAKAWTQGSVGRIALGNGEQRVVISGIVGRANVRQTRAGKVFRNVNGSSVGSITVNGTRHAVPDPGRTIEVPGLARIQFFVTTVTRRGVQVTAVRVTLLDKTPGVGVIDLGNARARITRH